MRLTGPFFVSQFANRSGRITRPVESSQARQSSSVARFDCEADRLHRVDFAAWPCLWPTNTRTNTLGAMHVCVDGRLGCSSPPAHAQAPHLTDDFRPAVWRPGLLYIQQIYVHKNTHGHKGAMSLASGVHAVVCGEPAHPWHAGNEWATHS